MLAEFLGGIPEGPLTYVSEFFCLCIHVFTENLQNSYEVRLPGNPLTLHGFTVQLELLVLAMTEHSRTSLSPAVYVI